MVKCTNFLSKLIRILATLRRSPKNHLRHKLEVIFWPIKHSKRFKCTDCRFFFKSRQFSAIIAHVNALAHNWIEAHRLHAINNE